MPASLPLFVASLSIYAKDSDCNAGIDVEVILQQWCWIPGTGAHWKRIRIQFWGQNRLRGRLGDARRNDSGLCNGANASREQEFLDPGRRESDCKRKRAEVSEMVVELLELRNELLNPMVG